MFKTTSAVRTLIQICFISKSLCYVALSLDLANTERGYCNTTNGVLIPVGDYAIDVDRCEKLHCQPDQISIEGCSQKFVPLRIGMECELLRGAGHYPDCCPHILSCRKIFDWPPKSMMSLPLPVDDAEDNSMYFSLTDQPVNTTPSAELLNEANSNVSALPTLSLVPSYREEDFTNYTHNRQILNVTPHVEYATEMEIGNANNFSDEYDFKSRPSLLHLISTPLPLSDTIKDSENNTHFVPVTEKWLDNDKRVATEVSRPQLPFKIWYDSGYP